MSYCSAIEYMSGDRKDLHKAYHDKLYGFPIHDDDELFCRLVLEINQAGLSWETILKKEKTFRQAYHNFNIKKVAAYDEKDRERLLADPGIIRNKLKVNAAIENAKTILQLQKEYGSFEKWLEHHHPKSKDEWVKIFKKTFKFTGGEIVNEFLMSIGYLEGAHSSNCKIHTQILKSKPMWLKTNKDRGSEKISIKKIIEQFTRATNQFDVKAALALFADNAVIDDVSVGEKFKKKTGVQLYLEKFFVGYHTVTRLESIEIINNRNAKAQVEFTGDFGHETGGLNITINNDGLITAIDAWLD